jgi:hypothetical protein
LNSELKRRHGLAIDEMDDNDRRWARRVKAAAPVTLPAVFLQRLRECCNASLSFLFVGHFRVRDENEAGGSHNDTFQVVHYDEITWRL